MPDSTSPWSKREVARQHIETGIRILRTSAHIPPVTLLAWAAIDLCRPFIVAKSGRSTLMEFEAIWPDDDKAAFWRDVKASYNFVKHADRDKDEVHSTNPMLIEVVLLIAIIDYRGAFGSWTLSMTIYVWWFRGAWTTLMAYLEKFAAIPRVNLFSDGCDLGDLDRVMNWLEQNPEEVQKVLNLPGAQWIER